jgi:UTP--glucose-1-phosphate uridylyltransferase
MRKIKSEAFEMARAVPPKHLAGLFVCQPEQLGVGHAVFCPRRAVADTAFAVLLSDDLMLQEDGAPEGDLVTACGSGGEPAISLAEIPLSDVGKCGVAAPGRELSETMLEVAPLQETPSSEAPPSLFANCGRYPCTPETLDFPERTRGQRRR